MEIYYENALHARTRGGLDKYRETRNAMRICRMDIETVLKARFDGMHLEAICVKELTAMQEPELIALVLSATILDKEWDGRFSRSNKEWAHTVRQVAKPEYPDYIVSTHPAILDGFVTMFRREVV